MEKISIIIPAHNEEKRIGNTLEDYGKFFANLKKQKILNSEIIIVINNTRDKTEEIVKIYKKKYKIIRYLNFEEGGKGLAIIEGFKEALKRENNLLIGFVDADMATKPEEYYNLAKNIGIYEGIIASRYLSGAKVYPPQSLKRIIASRVYNILIKIILLLDYKDTQCGAKIFKRGCIKKVINKLSLSRWAFDIDLLYALKKQKCKIKEFPTIWSDKEYSKLNLTSSGFQMFSSLIRLRLLNSPFKFVVNWYDKLPEKIKISV